LVHGVYLDGSKLQYYIEKGMDHVPPNSAMEEVDPDDDQGLRGDDGSGDDRMQG
jgi:hypothetical protein